MSSRYSASPRKYPHSSDTEQLETPPRKRFRPSDDDSSPSSSSVSPRKRQKRDSPKKQKAKEINLDHILRDCAQDSTDPKSFLKLKELPHDERVTRELVKTLMRSAKASVWDSSSNSKRPLLETELYLNWLDELEYVVTGLENALSAKILGTRKRMPGLGRPVYTILYNLVDEFIDEVSTHHDGSTCYDPLLDLYPPTMSLVEEANDPSTDDRSDEAVRRAEALLKNIDRVLANAVRRYKSERGWNNAFLAEKISSQEHALAKGCCLLCEQTGYGANDNDMGDTLMEDTRDIMTQWKNEYDDCEDQLVDSD